ncbi:MAG: polysaccharide biosynthesis C-terminal domain-containing protein, partial [Thermoplasmata archaeon]|nr:polysaccharide biosynthesis C-terminal domain-containing protein [Thermoplasmata archaeon]
LAIAVYRVPIAVLLNNGSVGQKGSMALAILAISAFPLGLSQVMGTALNSIGYQRLELYLSATLVAAMVASSIGLYLIYPNLAAIAAGVLVASIAAFALNAYFLEQLLRVKIRPWPIVRITAAAVLTFESLSLLNRYIDPSRWFALPLAILAGLGAYVLVLAAIGELTRRDVELVLGAVGLSERVGRTVGRICWREAPPP